MIVFEFQEYFSEDYSTIFQFFNEKNFIIMNVEQLQQRINANEEILKSLRQKVSDKRKELEAKKKDEEEETIRLRKEYQDLSDKINNLSKTVKNLAFSLVTAPNGKFVLHPLYKPEDIQGDDSTVEYTATIFCGFSGEKEVEMDLK